MDCDHWSDWMKDNLYDQQRLSIPPMLTRRLCTNNANEGLNAVGQKEKAERWKGEEFCGASNTEGGRGGELFITLWQLLQYRRLCLYLKYVVLVVFVQMIGAMVIITVICHAGHTILLCEVAAPEYREILKNYGRTMELWKFVWTPTLWKIAQSNDHKSVWWQCPQWKYGVRFYEHTQE